MSSSALSRADFASVTGVKIVLCKRERKGHFRAPAIGQAGSQVPEIRDLPCFNPDENSLRQKC